jgi:hypothetical protein
MRIEVWADVDCDVDEIIEKMDQQEKLDMYNSLSEELSKAKHDEEYDVAAYMSRKSLYEQKKIICNALGVGSYCDEKALRAALEKIIKA